MHVNYDKIKVNYWCPNNIEKNVFSFPVAKPNVFTGSIFPKYLLLTSTYSADSISIDILSRRNAASRVALYSNVVYLHWSLTLQNSKVLSLV